MLTVCEEVGLLGVQNLDATSLCSQQGLVLGGGAIQRLIHRAPACDSLCFEMVAPPTEAGGDRFESLDALRITAEALVGAPLGRIDAETAAMLDQIAAGALPHWCSGPE